MKLSRVLPWMGWAMTALIVVIGVGFWYLSAQRLRVDEENRHELSHVARDLTEILTELSSSAGVYFKVYKDKDNKRNETGIPATSVSITSSRSSSSWLSNRPQPWRRTEN